MNTLSIGELADITRGQLNLGSMPPLGGTWEPVHRVVTDSREVDRGDLFWAVPSRSNDGGIYAHDAFARGAAGVVTAGRPVEPWAGGYSLRVDDSLAALRRLARWSRESFAGTLIGVSGPDSPRIARVIDAVLRGQLLGMRSRAFETVSTPHRRLLELVELDASLDYAILPVDHDEFFDAGSISLLCQPSILVINCTRQTHPLNTRLWNSARQTDRLEILDPDGWAVVYGDEASCQFARHATPRVTTVGDHAGCDTAARHVHVRDGRLEFLMDNHKFSVPAAGVEDLPAVLIGWVVGKLMNVPAADLVRRLTHGHSAVRGHDAAAIREVA